MLSSEKVQKIREMVADDADLWDVLTALRGPDDEDMGTQEGGDA